MGPRIESTTFRIPSRSPITVSERSVTKDKQLLCSDSSDVILYVTVDFVRDCLSKNVMCVCVIAPAGVCVQHGQQESLICRMAN
jgi:hypothetical protein